MMAGACGTCTACCRLFTIPELDKPAGKWCQHCSIGKGCNIYESRPPVCIDFECLWLQTQSQGKAALPLELRPDKCRVVISPTTNERVISFMAAPGYENEWRKKGPLRDLITKLASRGVSCVMGPPASTCRTAVVRNTRTGKLIEKEVRMTAPDEKGMQWNITELTSE